MRTVLTEPIASVTPIPIAAPVIGDRECTAVLRVLRSGTLCNGPEVDEFEREFSVLVAGRQCVAVNSGTSALHLGLLAAGIGPGDEVIIPAFTFVATANAVALSGATPVFADIEPDTFCLSPQSAETMITNRTAAIMPVHIFGGAAAMPELTRLASKHGLAIFEDAAQAHGARVAGQSVGSFGLFGAFSLYPTKNMTAGEGGIVCVDPQLGTQRIRQLRNQGLDPGAPEQCVGFNNRMSELHGALARVQLDQLQTWTATRRNNAAILSDQLHGVVTPTEPRDVHHVYNQYTLRIVDHNRDRFGVELNRRGIATSVHYRLGLHQLPHFKQSGAFPATESACREVLSIPVHPSLSANDLERVIEAVNEIAAAGA